MYIVPVRRTCRADRMTCTAYSCQVMATTPAPDTAPAGTPEAAEAPATAGPAPSADPQRARLSKTAVVGRAIALADAEGLDALTIRRLAQELGVTPMALYWHFHNKEELLSALADQFWSEIDTDVDEAAPWAAQLRGVLESLVQVLRTHPSASELLIAGEKQSAAALEATEVTLEVLRRGGFDPGARQRGRPQCTVDRADAGHERARVRAVAERGRPHRAPAARPDPAGHAAAGPLPPPGRGGGADDCLRRPGLPLTGSASTCSSAASRPWRNSSSPVPTTCEG